jgi:hypothetical protein
MSGLDAWVIEISKCVRELRSEHVLGVDQPPDSVLSRKVAATGFPAVLPLWTGRRHIVGLLADPLANPETWSGVILQDEQGLTIASDARTLLPQLIVQRVLSNSPDTAEQLANRWSEVGEKALALHRILGGTDDELEAVVAVASDSVAREAFKYKQDRAAVFEAAHSSLCRKIDHSEPFVRYADWLDASIAGRWTKPEDPSRYGAWGRRVLCWAQRLAFAQPTMPRVPTTWLHRIVEERAGIDSGVPVEASWSIQLGASGEAALIEAAMVIDHEPPSTDPVSAGIVRAMLAEGTSYRGFAHAEAVVALDERGEPERAWAALQSAAWWAARNTGKVPDAMLEGARFLADRHGWVDVRWVVERAVKTA